MFAHIDPDTRRRLDSIRRDALSAAIRVRLAQVRGRVVLHNPTGPKIDPRRVASVLSSVCDSLAVRS